MVLRAREGRFSKKERSTRTAASLFPNVEVHFFQQPEVARILTQRDANFWSTFCHGKPISEWKEVFVVRRDFFTAVVMAGIRSGTGGVRSCRLKKQWFCVHEKQCFEELNVSLGREHRFLDSFGQIFPTVQKLHAF